MSYGHEFSDRLSPFLVKELRQGLRGKAYLTLFLVLITALGTYSLSFISADPENSGKFEGGMFNAIVFLALAILLPLNNLGAIGEERRGRKIELVMLSRIKARGVVFGKWGTGAMQSVTLSAVIAPFIVLRYFAGGVNMVDDLEFLVFSLAAGLAFSAVTMAVSAFVSEAIPVISAILKGIILLGSLWVGLMLAFALMNPFGGGGLMNTRDLMLTALAVLVIGTPVVLEIAAARLSPEAENHDGPIRLLSLAAAGAASGVLWWVFGSSGGNPAAGCVAVATAIILIVSAFTLFSTPLQEITYRTPLDRFGVFGKKIGRAFFSSGWPSGFAFMLLAGPALAVALFCAINSRSNDNQPALGLLQFWAALLWPLIPIAFLHLSASRRFGIWLLLQIAGCLLAILAHTQRWTDKSHFDILPTTGLFNIEHNTTSVACMGGVGLTFIGVLVTMLYGFAKKNDRA